MFIFPQIFSAPLLSGLSNGTADSPTLGVVLAWLLIAALVGSALGILRERSRVMPAKTRKAVVPRATPLRRYTPHHQAA